MKEWNWLSEELDRLREQELYRTMTVLDGPQTTVVESAGRPQRLFSSNNYLDLANDPEVKAAACEALEQYGVGAGGSRLTTGTGPFHVRLEEELARFKGREAALVFNTGYMANVGIISALMGRGDVIFSDQLNHASIIDGCRLSGAEVVVYRHNDMADLEDKLRVHQGRKGLIVSDGVFSMDGDLLPLPQLVELAKRYGVRTMIDEAHATGVVGATGRGTEEYYHMEGSVDVLMGTLSKAVGSEGGFVCGSAELIQYLINKARSFIFSTALSPVTMAAGLRGLQKIQEEPQRVAQLRDNMAFLCRELGRYGISVQSDSAILPIIVGEEKRAMAAMEAKGHEGEELLLLYLDSGAQQVSASWAAASQWKTGG